MNDDLKTLLESIDLDECVEMLWDMLYDDSLTELAQYGQYNYVGYLSPEQRKAWHDADVLINAIANKWNGQS